MLQAWSSLGGVICVSRFVESYLRQWAPDGTFTVPEGKDAEVSQSGGATSSGVTPLTVVPLSAWTCFGTPPYPNFGRSVRSWLHGKEGSTSTSAVGNKAEASTSGKDDCADNLCVGMLKLSPEKGCSIVFEVARRMPHLRCGIGVWG